MLEVVTDYLGAVQFEVRARGHKIYCDQPTENGGFDEGMTPPEWFLASLGACAGYYAVQYLNARKLTAAGLRIRTNAEKAPAPARLNPIHIDVEYPAGLDDRDRDGLLQAVHKCLIHNTLVHPPELTVRVATPEMASV